MGWRFRRRVRILPGLYINLSKSGGSVSIGGHGATLNLGPHGTRTTVGLPGSGLSYRSPLNPWTRHPSSPTRPRMTAAPPRAVAPLHPMKFTEEDPDMSPEILSAATAKRSRPSLGVLFAVFLALGALGLAGMAALDAAMKASTEPAPPIERVHRGHDG